jgi:hypothetical protein
VNQNADEGVSLIAMPSAPTWWQQKKPRLNPRHVPGYVIAVPECGMRIFAVAAAWCAG